MSPAPTEKHVLQEILEGEFEVRSYSGRGMYGRECLGVDVGRGELGELLAVVVENVEEDDRYEVAQVLRGMATDSMGLGMIVYFPGVPFFDDGSDDDEEDES